MDLQHVRADSASERHRPGRIPREVDGGGWLALPPGRLPGLTQDPLNGSTRRVTKASSRALSPSSAVVSEAA